MMRCLIVIVIIILMFESAFNWSDWLDYQRTKAIENDLNWDEDSVWTTKLCFSDKACLEVIVDTGSYSWWVRDRKLNEMKYGDYTTIEGRIDLNYISGSVVGELSQSNLFFSTPLSHGMQSSNSLFTYIRATTVNINANDNLSGILGLAKYYDMFLINTVNNATKPESFSWIDYWYITKRIHKKRFSIQYLTTSMGWLSIGDIWERPDLRKCHSVQSKFDDIQDSFYSKYYWTCHITSFGTKHSSNLLLNDSIYQIWFDTGSNVCYFPSFFYNEMLNKYIQSSSTKCTSINNDHIQCENSFDIGDFPTFYLTLSGGIAINIYPVDVLFLVNTMGETIYRLMIIPNESKSNTFWVGNIVWKRYQLLFDMEDFTVGVIENEEWKTKWKMKMMNKGVWIEITIVIIDLVLCVWFTLLWICLREINEWDNDDYDYNRCISSRELDLHRVGCSVTDLII